MGTLLRLEAVEKVYRMGEVEVHALHSLSLDLERGESIAIMGASGSGKSTTLNLIGTLDRPSAGHYWLDGESVEGLDDDALAALRNRKIGFVFQSFHLLPRLTAQANVELPMVYAGIAPAERHERARDALARVGLEDRADHRPTQLSGGQQQRVAIARAIVNEPVLLLADEPTGALDSTMAGQIMDLFETLRTRGITLVLVTHDAAVGAHMERVITFADGRLVSDARSGAPS